MRVLWSLLCLLLAFSASAQSITYTGSLCPGGTLQLSVQGAPPGATYQWIRDGSNLAGATAAVYTASTPGSYGVVVTSGGVPNTLPPVDIAQKPNPVANFSFTPTGQCPSTPVQFTNSSIGAASYSWNFGDPNSGSDNTSTEVSPQHRFRGFPGNTTQNLTVRLTAISADGCSNTRTATVNLKQSPGTELKGPNETTYDGKKYFTQCSNAASSAFTFINQSSTKTTNTNYKIIWGDGSPDYTATSFTNQTHSFAVGTYKLQFVVTGGNGCEEVGEYYIFVGSIPAVGFNNPGNTSICTGATLTFPITGTGNNPAGTVYTVTFNDGTPPIKYTHPAPADVSHTFLKNSCGVTSAGYRDSYSATIEASNPCLTASATVVPIYVSQKPEPKVTAPEAVCVNTTVSVSSTNVSSYIANGRCQPGGTLWRITPATGWSLSSGSLGTDNGFLNDPTLWTSGSATLGIRFSAVGTYTLELVAGNGSCGNASATRTICVSAVPQAAFSTDVPSGCAPLTVTTTNTSTASTCGANTYAWSVSYTGASGCTPTTSSYSYLNGTSASSQHPQFRFVNPGTYTIFLTTSTPGGACYTTVSKSITVRARPVVTLSVPASLCAGSSATPTAMAIACLSTTPPAYLWTLEGGTPASATSLNPGVVTFATAGTYNLTFAATNECGTTTQVRPITVNPAPDFTVPASLTVCGGALVGPLSFSSTTTGVTYRWTNSHTSIGLPASGTSNPIPAFTAVNNSQAPVVATINVTASQNGCNPTKAFTLTVNPRPATPAVTSPVNYCLGATATALSATAAAGHSLNWFASATGTPLPAAPIPSTATLGTTTYYVSQVHPTYGCESPKAAITVGVQAAQTIASSSFASPTACGTANGTITLGGFTGGASYTVTYRFNGTAVTRTLSSNSTGSVVITSLGAGTYTEVAVSRNGCMSNAVGPFTLVDANPPSEPLAASNGPLCSGGALNLTASSSATGAVTYQWSGPNNFSSTLQNPSFSNVTAAASGTYYVTARVNGCTSPPGSVDVLVRPAPVLTSAGSNSPLCPGGTLTLTAQSNESNLTFAWTGPNGFTSSEQNPTLSGITPAAAGTYTVAASNGGCLSAPKSVVVTIGGGGATTLSATAANPTTCATATGTLTLNGLSAGTAYEVHYTKNGVPLRTALTAGSGGVMTLGGLTAGTYSDIWVSGGGCASNKVGPFTLIDPSAPAAPSASSNGPVCSGGTLMLSASSSTAGTPTYQWSGPGGFTSTQQNPAITGVTPAASGKYLVVVRVGGCSSAPAEVDVVVRSGLPVPTVTNNGPLCSGGTLELSSGAANPLLLYQWSGPGGFSSSEANPRLPAVTKAQSGTYSLVVSQGGCASPIATTQVNIAEKPVIPMSSHTHPSSCTATPGVIYLSGLTPFASYRVGYTKDGGAPGEVSLASDASGVVAMGGLSAGTYTNVTVSLAGCTSAAVGPFILEDKNLPVAPSARSSGAVCEGGAIQLFATSSLAGNVSYAWSGPNGFTSSLQNPVIAKAPLGAGGTYRVTVSAGGCTSLPATTEVEVSPAPRLQTSQDLSLCQGNSARISTQGAATYQWTPLEGLSCSTCADPVARPSRSTEYVVEGRNALGCSAYDTVRITVLQPFRLSVSGGDSLCAGESTNLSAHGAPRYQWYPADGLSSATISNPVASPTTTTRYMVVGTDAQSCFTDTGYVTVAVGQKPTVDLGGELTLPSGSFHTLSPMVQNGPVERWLWFPPTDLSCADCPQPVASIRRDIRYSVRVTNAYGCTAESTVSIRVLCDKAQVFIPNAFSPDGDGVNDVLMVRTGGTLRVKSFRVFNRWGELVFERSNINSNEAKDGWDGKVRGVVGSPDVYVYTAEVQCGSGETFQFKGNVSIIK